MRQKYDAVTRKRVWGEIEKLMALHLPAVSIAEQMAKAGFKMPDAKAAITSGYVGAVMRRLDNKANEPGITVNGIKPLAKSDRLPSAVVGILTDPTLNAEQKVRMCIAFAEL